MSFPDGVSADLLAALRDALRRHDEGALRALAALAVQRFSGIDAQRAGTASYYLYRVLRRLDLSNLLQRAIHEERDGPEDRAPLDESLFRDDQRRRIEELRRLIADEIRRRLVEIQGPDAAADIYRRASIEDVDFLGATPAQLRDMRTAIRPLARKLAARIAHRRRFRRRGRLDARRTIRRSLSAGGVPLEPAFRHPKVSRPDLYLLCDLSGSVAEFARFTISFLYAMNEEFSRIRSFAFVDGVDEVTGVLDDRSAVLDEGPRTSGGTHTQLLTVSALPAKLGQLANLLTHSYRIVYAHPDSLIPPQQITVAARRAGLTAFGAPDKDQQARR